MLPSFYLQKYKNYDVHKMIEELNSDEDRNWIKSFTLSVMITQFIKDTTAAFTEGNRNIETYSQLSTELFMQSYILKRKLSYDEVYHILREEFQIQFSWVGGQSKILPATSILDFRIKREELENNEIDYISEMIVEGQFQDEVLNLTPDRLKLYMAIFVRTLSHVYKNYPILDQYLIDLILFESGYTMDLKNYNFLSQLETLHEKAVFLSILATEEPELFILLTSVSDINKFLLLLQYQKLFKTRKNILLILEGIVRKSKTMVESNARVDDIMVLLAERLNLVIETTDIITVLNDYLDKLSAEYDTMLDGMIKRAKVTGNYLQIANLLQKETAQSVAVLENFRKSKVGNVIFKQD